MVNYEPKGDPLATPARHVDDVKVTRADLPFESTNQEEREPSVQDIMALAERIRGLRVGLAKEAIFLLLRILTFLLAK